MRQLLTAGNSCPTGREPHNSRENIITRLIQTRTPRERHTQLQSKSICLTSLNRIRDHLTFADASDITRDGNQHSFHQVNHSVYMYCRSLQMLCPQLKELSLYSTASPHRPSHRLSGAAVHPSRDGAENECTNNKAESLQQTILVHIDTSKVEFHLKTLIPGTPLIAGQRAPHRAVLQFPTVQCCQLSGWMCCAPAEMVSWSVW